MPLADPHGHEMHRAQTNTVHRHISRQSIHTHQILKVNFSFPRSSNELLESTVVLETPPPHSCMSSALALLLYNIHPKYQIALQERDDDWIPVCGPRVFNSVLRSFMFKFCYGEFTLKKSTFCGSDCHEHSTFKSRLLPQ